MALGQQVRALNAAGDFEGARQAATQALALAPGHPIVLADLALCQMRLNDFDAARLTYLQAVRAQPDNENTLDGLAECCGRSGRLDEAATHGRRALALKAAQVAGQPAWPLPAAQPPAFDASRPERNLVVFTLFGANPRYCETALMNVLDVARLLPGWRCRIYLDASVPTHVQQRLATAGAQLVDMGSHPARAIHPLMWRFLVLDDPTVDRFLLRDADSLVSEREVAAVQAWLDSGHWFHLMRDYCTHSELLLAGMWGGCGGVFRGVATQLLDATRRPPQLGTRLIDQHWLRSHAWPTVRQSVLAHDTVFGFDGGLPFPTHPPVASDIEFHVGMNMGSAHIGAATSAPDGTPITWCLVDLAVQREVCRYSTPARGGRWGADLPRLYAVQLQAGRWRCDVMP
ncbi:MAG: hypothetical protein RJA98_1567 [Pseudomonadota bacterium]